MMEIKALDGIPTNSSAKEIAEAWLCEFGAALFSGEATRTAAPFASECHWRDILAFAWTAACRASGHRRDRGHLCLRNLSGPV
jgi:hypothetical protein